MPTLIDLASTTVHVIYLNLDHERADAVELLDETEKARASKFAFTELRQRFITAHAWTRVILGRCLSQSPEALCFSYGPHGKPALCAPFDDLQFNLSHSDEHALLAFALGREVGVDIEKERELEVLAVAKRFFAPAEILAIEVLPHRQRAEVFFRTWTRKEAFIKALGVGMSLPLDVFDTSAESAAPRITPSYQDSPFLKDEWKIISLPVPSRCAGAVAARGTDWRLLQWQARAFDGTKSMI